jgi:hypothetical protein
VFVFPWSEFSEAERTGTSPVGVRHWFVSHGKTEAERAAISAWLEPRLNLKRVGRPKLKHRQSTAALQGKCRWVAKTKSADQARADFAGRLTPKQIDAAIGKNPNSRIRKEYSANKLLAEFSG